MDCKNTEVYLGELQRMCNYFIQYGGGGCKNCEMKALAGSYGAGSCELAHRIKPDFAIAIVQAWSDNNPIEDEFQ